MTPAEMLAELRALEARLRSSEVQAAYRERPPLERRRLVAERAELSLLIARLTTAELAAVAATLDELGRDLSRSLAAVKGRLARLDRPAATLNALARLLGLLARLAVLAG